MSEFSQGTEAHNAEAFREFHAEHLRRQTKAIETIRSVVVVWFVLMVAGVLLALVAANQSSGF